MAIHVAEHPEYFIFSFEDHGADGILLSSELENSDIVVVIQAALDSLKPVVIAKSARVHLSEDEIKKHSRHHVFFKDQQYIFLNYSIRNKLSQLPLGEGDLQHFNGMHDLLNKLLIQKSQ